MTDRFDSHLGTALRDRVADVHPDLDRLVATSVRAGSRIRLRRRIGASAVAVAGVAVIAGGGALLGGGATPRSADGGVGFAGDPTVSATPTPAAPALVAGRSIAAPSGVTVQVAGVEDFALTGEVLSQPAGQATFALVLPEGYTRADLAWLEATYPGQLIATAAAPRGGLVDHVPAEVTAPGWTCEWYLADDKAACSGPAGEGAGLVVRPAQDHAAWIRDADKGAGGGVFTTEPHGGVFITVQGGQGTTDAELARIGRSLAWVD